MLNKLFLVSILSAALTGLSGCGDILSPSLLKTLEEEDITGTWVEQVFVYNDTVTYNGAERIESVYSYRHHDIEVLPTDVYRGRAMHEPLLHSSVLMLEETEITTEALLYDWDRTKDGLRYQKMSITSSDTSSVEFVIPSTYLEELFAGDSLGRGRVDSLYILDYNTKDTLHRLERLHTDID